MEAGALTRALKDKAEASGFDAVGVARADALDRDGEALAAWLRRDGHASMAWMAREPERRADPRRILPGAKSVVALAMSYWPGEERSGVEPGAAQVALYARGRDYHKVMGKKLRDLASWLEGETGSPSRAFVDTAPILERAWAERSGVGWIGKNANLLTRGGSWLLLGEIVTVAELVPDPGPHADFCGTCTACLDACPTDAIVEPGVVDSHRCISYWTIEHRGAIPEERRTGLHDWIFGCDVCQTICPWNQAFASPRTDDPFSWRDDLREVDPVAILEMEEAEFRRRYSGTALMRARWDGMRRNACIVLGNRRETAAIGALRRALDDADPVIRDSAAWAIRRIEEGPP